MDVASAYSGMQTSATMSQIQIAVAKKVMDAQRMDGAAALKLLAAASASFTKAGDQLVAAATGLGGQIDVSG